MECVVQKVRNIPSLQKNDQRCIVIKVARAAEREHSAKTLQQRKGKEYNKIIQYLVI
jgi:hypothetical protein